MSFWGETAAKKLDLQWLSARKPERRSNHRPLIAVASQIEALGRLQRAIHEGASGVVIHGPSGSGRSLVSRQLCRVAGGLAHHWEEPPIIFDDIKFARLFDSSIFSQKKTSEIKQLKLIRIDTLTLHHRGWEAVAAANMMPKCQMVIVASTAWWFLHRPMLGSNWADACLKLLNPGEIEHLANSVRWQKRPLAKTLTSVEIEAIDTLSEGLAAEVVRLAERT
jgi:hypothetical protein